MYYDFETQKLVLSQDLSIKLNHTTFTYDIADKKDYKNGFFRYHPREELNLKVKHYFDLDNFEEKTVEDKEIYEEYLEFKDLQVRRHNDIF